MNFRQAVDYLFNWRKHPASVFFLAIPLAAIGFGCLLLRGVLELVWHHDPVFLVIDIAGLVMLFVALWPIRKPLLRQLKGK